MSDTNTVTNKADEAPTNAPPAVPVSEEPCIKVITKTEVVTEDIPAVDADVKESGDAPVVEKTNGKAHEKVKVPEPPKDPKEDFTGWINSLIPQAVHKVNYQVLNWAQQLAVEEEDKRQPLPGKNEAVTKNQFLGFLRDGVILAKLAQRLQPESAETVYEGEDAKDKEKQTSNINVFTNFVKQNVGLPEQQVFTAADLQDKGKSGYQAVANTIVQLCLLVSEKFQQKGLDTDQLVQIAAQAVRSSIVQTVLNFFRRARPTQTSKQLAKEAEEKEKAEKVAEKVVEEKVVVVANEPPAIVEPSVPAVSAN